MMIDQLAHVADLKVGTVKGKSKVYPQLRLPSQYADLAGKKASMYEMRGSNDDIAFVIRFENRVMDYREAVQRPCRGSDSG
jgi:hypothetical protein